MDADYYGYRDEDDGIIVPLEQEEEKRGELPSDCCCNLIKLAFFYLLSTVNTSPPITADVMQLQFKGNCNSQYIHYEYIHLASSTSDVH